jgi:DNA-binding protein YbaB
MDMTDPLSAFDALTRRIEAIQHRMGGLREELGELSATATDDTGLISATVDATGGLTGLTVDPRAMRTTSHELAEMVLAAARRAKAELGREVTDRADDLDGEVGVRLGTLFGRPGDFSAENRMDAIVARLEALDSRLPGPPA